MKSGSFFVTRGTHERLSTYMTQNPFHNALAAAGYIILIVSGLTFGSTLVEPNTEDNIFMPMAMLSLFVLSAAVMGYIFLYNPILMIMDGKRTEAAQLFLRTVAAFAAITVVIFFVSFILI